MVGPPSRQNVYKVFKRKDLRPDFPVQVLWLKATARLFGRAAFFYLFLF